MIYIDTNYLVRFFIKDIKNLAKKARRIIKSEKVYISEIVLAETDYILENHYEVSKINVCDKLISLLHLRNVTSPDFSLFSLEIYKSENISFYDCLIMAEAISHDGELKTFDQKLKKVWKKYS